MPNQHACRHVAAPRALARLVLLWHSRWLGLTPPARPCTQFYSCAVSGKPLSDALTGGGPAPIGCTKANLTSYYGIAKNIADDEIAHVGFLRKALGSAAVKCPLVDIGPAFAAAANAAANATLSPPFTPYANDLFFLHGAFIFEDVGVTAYKGGVPILQGGPTAFLDAAAGALCTRARRRRGAASALSALLHAAAHRQALLTFSCPAHAAGILGVEAYHAGAVRTLLLDSVNVVLPYNVTVGAFIQAISNLRDTLDGTQDKADKGIVLTNGAPILAPVDAQAVAFSRTPQQVLRIVYGGGKPGLFFPDGMNGKIR